MSLHEADDGASSADRPDARSAWSKLLSVMTSISAVLLYVLAFLVTLDVTYRWLMGRPVAGVFEVSEVLLLAITFLALAGVQASNRQLSVDILTSEVTGRRKSALRLLDATAASVFFLVLLWTGWVDFRESLSMGLQGSGLVRIPTAVPLGLLVFGTLVMLITLARQLFQDMRALVTRDGHRHGGDV
jgi:TRAP-type C4-dicarboxylate transport system permease small subunit